MKFFMYKENTEIAAKAIAILFQKQIAENMEQKIAEAISGIAFDDTAPEVTFTVHFNLTLTFSGKQVIDLLKASKGK